MHPASTIPSSLYRSVSLVLVVAGLALLAAPGASLAEEAAPPEDYSKIKIGEGLFRAYCATCHGTAAEGDGPLAESLRVTPADLTVLARENDGEFPFERVLKRIDGREKVRGHGPSDMPVWGTAFLQVDKDASEEDVQNKVLSLAHYIRSLQAAVGGS